MAGLRHPNGRTPAATPTLKLIMTSSGHEPAAKPPSYRRYRITAGEPTLEYRRLLDRVPEASEIT
jgi:hypothetical protein